MSVKERFPIVSIERIPKGKYTYYKIYIPRDLIENVLGWKDVKNVILIPTLVNNELCLLVKKYG